MIFNRIDPKVLRNPIGDDSKKTSKDTSLLGLIIEFLENTNVY